jgi:hypothetical protein
MRDCAHRHNKTSGEPGGVSPRILRALKNPMADANGSPRTQLRSVI